MDKWYSDELIIYLWKVMFEIDKEKGYISDNRDIDEEIYNSLDKNIISEEFDSYDEFVDGETIFLPDRELINDIQNAIPLDSNITLIGWWINECLKEIYLLLKVLWYNNITIDNDLTY